MNEVGGNKNDTSQLAASGIIHSVKTVSQIEGQMIPSQIYQSLVNLIAFVVFSLLIIPLHRNGLIMGLFLVYYGIARMLFEKIRADIYFEGKRKWLTFYVSMTAAIIGVLYLSAGRLFIPQLFEHT
ncbi:MAG: prolipoprotein diacylglyceryl transferase [Bacillota bacterium]|nr:prolipoprotein diacylglyceryl transferase [Bacillota bacterium]MDW7678278.1 prolipoprotein diacylglyceryl transferase [Bacillota bacterium]